MYLLNIFTVGLLCLVMTLSAYTQQMKLGFNPSSINKSAVLEINADRQGLLLPRINDTSLINTLHPPDGMVVFFSPTKQLLIRSDNAWKVLVYGGTSSSWNINGNTGLNAANAFLGTTDNIPLILKSNNNTYLSLGSRTALGLVESHDGYNNGNELLMHLRSAIQFDAPGIQFKPKISVDGNGNLRVKGSAGNTDYFEFGATGTSNDGGFELIVGDDGNEPIVFKNYSTVTGMKEIMRLQHGNMAIGTNVFDGSNAEKLLVDAGTTNSFNLISGRGSINNYLQLNIKNQSAGTHASSDVVATANNGSETTNFVNLGINSSGFANTSYPVINGANNAYLYSTGNDFVIGNAIAGKNLRFFTGGYANANERMRIDGNGNVGIGTTSPSAKVDVNGTHKLGAKGSVNKNVISLVYTVPSNITIPAGSSTGTGSLSILLLGNYTVNTTNTINAGVVDMSVSLSSPHQPTTTQATVTVSPAFDLPNNIVIAFARASSTSALKVRFQNNGTTAQTITSGQQFYITINEF